MKLLALKFSVICFLSFNSFSQTIGEESIKVVLNETEINSNVEAVESFTSIEEQGFELVSGIEQKIYRKEVNGIIIEFNPEVK